MQFGAEYFALALVTCVYCYADGQLFMRRNNNKSYNLKQKLQEKINQVRQRNTQTVCYDVVGCFELPHKRSPLQKMPENPDILNTKFYLLRRDLNFSHPDILHYDDDGESLKKSKFNASQPLKLIIHGYMGKWSMIGSLKGAEAYLKIYDCNVILMDWSMGARGPQYALAAANSEVAGRQLGILLLRMVESGLNPDNIHLLGFSLGAHVAGSSSEVLKKKNHLIGRITGLDAASPLFRTNTLREQTKKLDRSDARFVDVLHTDSSPSVTDGFGLWQPIGHVDFFPNGGQEQPGCNDLKQSIISSHFDRSLTRQVACSHIRAWRLFEETLLAKAQTSDDQCTFTAFSCPGGLSEFERGFCFPHLPQPNSSIALSPSYRHDLGQFGEDVKGAGVMFFVTRGVPPYCGSQLQIAIHLSERTDATQGSLKLRFSYSSQVVALIIPFEISDFLVSGTVINALAATKYNSLDDRIKAIQATLEFIEPEFNEENNNTYSPLVFIDKIVIRDMYNNNWQFCRKDTLIFEAENPTNATTPSLVLSKDNNC